MKGQGLRLLVLGAVVVSLTIYLTREEIEPDRHPEAPSEPYPPGTFFAERLDGAHRVVDSRLQVMGTLFGVEAAVRSEEEGREVCRAAYRRIAELERAMSTYLEDSTLSRVNREAASRKVPVDPDTYAVLLRARRAHRKTGGAFDPSIGPLLGLWVPLARLQVVPSDEDVRAALAHVGYDDVELDSNDRTVRFRKPGMALDLGAIAKGYAADQAAAVALEAGALACRVTAGGDLVARKAPPWSPEGFEVLVRDPSGSVEEFLPHRSFFVVDRGVATSGNYERYTEIGDRRYSHILDPRTGRPVPDAVVQVTVIASDGATADALATALAVLGPEDGLAHVEARPNVEALFIVRDGEGYTEMASSGFPEKKR